MGTTPRMLFGLLFACCVIACSSKGVLPGGSASAPDAAARAGTPRPQAVIPLGLNTADKAGYHISLSIASGPTKPFLFDTGSQSVWVYFNAMGRSKNYVNTHVVATNSYGSGITYTGLVVYTTVNFGNGIVAKNTPVVVVTDAACATYKPNCPAAVTQKNCPNVYANPPKQRAAIFCLEEGRGLWGTFGADIEPDVVATPSPPATPPAVQPVLYNAFFGIAPWATRFIVSPHEVQLGPPQRSLRAFTMIPLTTKPIPTSLPNGAQGWERDMQLCFTIGTYVSNYCVNTLFDTGATDITFQIPAPFPVPTNPSKCNYAVSGSPVAFTEPDGTSLATLKTGYISNFNAFSFATPKPKASPQVNTGLTFFNRDEILFDAHAGRVGLLPLPKPGNIGRYRCSS